MQVTTNPHPALKSLPSLSQLAVMCVALSDLALELIPSIGRLSLRFCLYKMFRKRLQCSIWSVWRFCHVFSAIIVVVIALLVLFGNAAAERMILTVQRTVMIISGNNNDGDEREQWEYNLHYMYCSSVSSRYYYCCCCWYLQVSNKLFMNIVTLGLVTFISITSYSFL